MVRRKKIGEHITGGKVKIGEVDMPREKSVAVTYAFWLFLGYIGGHRYYLGKFLTGILFTITLGCLGIGWFIDAFRIPSITRKTNRGLWERWFAKQSDRWIETSGTARNVNSTTIQPSSYPGAATSKQVLNFRVEEINEDGSIVNLVPVELIGNQISGSIRDGDSVKVKGKMSKENILRTLSVDNETTGSRLTVQF